MKVKNSTESSIVFFTKGFIKLNKVILLAVVFCASVSTVWATQVNVTSFGAIGDGNAPSPTDNRGAIQAAIDSVATSGGTVYFPPGHYLVSSTLYVPSNVRLQGLGSTSNCQIRLKNTQVPLFEIGDGSSNITFKDLALYAYSRGWPRTTPTEVGLIRGEGTIGIAFKAAGLGISNIDIDNVRISQFTQGISATSTITGYDANITNVNIRNYASDGNEYSLYTKTRGANDWDVQNMNVYPMYEDQNGLFLELSGQMRFLQLSCAGISSAGICAKLWGNGDTYFRNMHVEGPRLGFCVGSTNCDQSSSTTGENASLLTVENSAPGGEFHRATNLVSINNRFWLDLGSGTPYEFFGTGANSWFMSCGDVWVKWDPYTHMTDTTVTAPPGAFPGLNSGPYGCISYYLSLIPNFDKEFTVDERLPDEVNVVTDFGANPLPGNDDTQAFVNALQAATQIQTGDWAPSMRVFVPAGTYNVSATLRLYGGETFVGEEGSIINYTGNDSLFIVAATPAVVKGITWRNLVLSAGSTTGTAGIEMEPYMINSPGGATDFQIQDVDFIGFDKGIWVHPYCGTLSNTDPQCEDLSNAQPMFDSVSLKDSHFSGNNTAILIRSQNASNWNLEEISVDIPDGKEGVRIDGIGIMSIRDLLCSSSSGTGSACATVQRQNGLIIDDLDADNVTNALVVRWENGWTQFPFTLRNSNLLEGVYFQGRVYLNSINNDYPNNLFSKVVKFGAYQEGNQNNIAYGGLSDVFSCGDSFISSSSSQSAWTYTGTLSPPVTYCY